jgi:nitrite reductase (NADH) large subunit
MSMGVKLEKMLFDMYAPHKVKLAVSGCPRNCAEAGIKDVGVIGVDSGYELYIGGNGGIKTEVAQFLCKVTSTRRSWNIPAPSCSSTAKKAGTWSAPATTSNASAWTTSRARSSRTKKVARLYAALLDSLKDAKDPWATSREPEAIKQFIPIMVEA